MVWLVFPKLALCGLTQALIIWNSCPASMIFGNSIKRHYAGDNAAQILFWQAASSCIILQRKRCLVAVGGIAHVNPLPLGKHCLYHLHDIL